MKARNFGIMAVAAVMLVGCGKLPEGKNLSELKDATTADSVANLLGQQGALQYWYMSQQDTTISTDEGREEYIKGFLKGMNLISDNDAYNAGLRSGLETALSLKKIGEDYMLDLSKDKYLEGMAYGMKSDSTVNQEDLQMDLMQIGQRLEQEKTERDQAEAAKKLESVAKKENLVRNGDYAYKIVKKGSGVMPTAGTMVSIDVSICDENGKELYPATGPMPMEIGAGRMPQAINDVLQKMPVGSEAVVYAPMTVLGMGKDAKSIAKVTIKLIGLCDEDGNPSTEPVIGPMAKMRAEQAEKVVK